MGNIIFFRAVQLKCLQPMLPSLQLPVLISSRKSHGEALWWLGIYYERNTILLPSDVGNPGASEAVPSI